MCVFPSRLQKEYWIFNSDLSLNDSNPPTILYTLKSSYSFLFVITRNDFTARLFDWSNLARIRVRMAH